ncbi:hypothetical protein [Natrialba swarupiae]|uniref:Uncharacterized protein n=1 Tax=Natrialba swarupiae TaxID=2448032 RepID=A0A5D5ARY8_9EURY|nr:hypothetical protein [Natrialba swarupiae]MCW8172815.1 hypothetical protein [Natrialba swarupiae]TYT61831.1 hypothetical protein FYC77_11340 [Natrialba swarupiae]
MKRRQRLIVGVIWIVVAALMALTVGVEVPSSVGDVARLFVVVLALFLAALYLFDPWNVISRKPFE